MRFAAGGGTAPIYDLPAGTVVNEQAHKDLDKLLRFYYGGAKQNREAIEKSVST
jgi:hypothetical protein